MRGSWFLMVLLISTIGVIGCSKQHEPDCSDCLSRMGHHTGADGSGRVPLKVELPGSSSPADQSAEIATSNQGNAINETTPPVSGDGVDAAIARDPIWCLIEESLSGYAKAAKKE